ncbi:MAG: hypothetical protein V4773_06680 [Verrucomicrobiota bacterium]
MLAVEHHKFKARQPDDLDEVRRRNLEIGAYDRLPKAQGVPDAISTNGYFHRI